MKGGDVDVGEPVGDDVLDFDLDGRLEVVGRWWVVRGSGAC